MLTLGQLNKLAKKHNLGDDTPICIPYGMVYNSIPIHINDISITKEEYSYANEDLISLTCTQIESDLIVRTLIGKNKWNRKRINEIGDVDFQELPPKAKVLEEVKVKKSEMET